MELTSTTNSFPFSSLSSGEANQNPETYFLFYLLHNMVSVLKIINITTCCFGFLGYPVSMKTINSKCEFAPQCWELEFF